MNKYLSMILIFFIILFSEVYVNSQEKEINKITLDEFIKSAIKNSHFQEILMSELQLVYQERLKVPPGELLLTALTESKLSYNDLTEDQIRYSEKIKEKQQLKVGVGLSKLFSETGTKISGDYSVLVDNDKNVTHSLNFKFEQSIVKNAFGNTTRFKTIIAGYERQIAYFQVVEAYEEYLASLIVLFIDWYSAYENLKFAEKALQESQSLLKNMESKLQYNIAFPIDVQKTELQVVTKKEQLLQRQLDYKNFLIQIKEIISFNNSTVDIIPDFSSFFKDFEVDLKDTYDFFKKESRTSNMMDLVNKTNSLSLVLTVDDLLPSAKLYGGYTFQKEYKELIDPTETHDTTESHAFNLGINMDFSIPQIGTFANYRNKKIEKDKKILNQKNTMHDFWIDFNILSQKIQNEKALLDLSAQKIELSKKIADGELRQYNQGRSSLNDLIQVYDTLDTNRLSQINHKILFSKYYIEWLRLSDTLVTNEKDVNLQNK